ncbi:superoxide dismutase [Armillaria luteobubalina]|uniref:Superoxide dismutase [Cu-Zn] n=1 Tax=Armillaria luteobubalina TaxID=153913 RepID=A0AA39PYP4_9AGAR|nr:superoxide dismutase [Armillaria luteobubalina]
MRHISIDQSSIVHILYLYHYPSMMFTSILFALAAALSVLSSDSLFVSQAVSVMTGPGQVKGTVIFQQSSVDGPVHITGSIQGLDPSSLRGFHVHTSGNLTGGCDSTGEHWNPFNTTHGGLQDPKDKRHVGDLENVKTDANGVATLDITDDIMSLNGPLSIVGRAIVVHAGTDDLGKGGTPLSLINGNSGDRISCGVIGLS